MIKAILFDFDGVLTIDKTGSEVIIRYIASKTGIPDNVFKAAYYRYNDGLLLGEFTHRDIWANLCRDLHAEIDDRLLDAAFENTRLDFDMLAYARELKKRFKIGMITDNKSDRIAAVSRVHHFDEIFDIVTVSADVHARKDSRVIFDLTLSRLGTQPDECVFIDNSPENLVVPKAMGMATILFDDENRDIGAFKDALGALIPG